jgi:hypothetical protein
VFDAKRRQLAASDYSPIMSSLDAMVVQTRARAKRYAAAIIQPRQIKRATSGWLGDGEGMAD